jgi:uncharacterized repeat protein (TIGR01451 family)
VAGPAFTCAVPTSFLSQGTPSTQLFFSTYGAGSVTYTPLGSAFSGTYNALAFNPADDYLYAVTLSSNTLLKIDSTGGVTNLGAVTGLPITSNSPANGAFDTNSDSVPGHMWVTGGNGSTTAYEIDVTTTPPKVITTLTLSKAWQPIDFSSNSGFMWGLASTTIYRMDLSSGTVTTFAAPSGVNSGNFGAAWTLSNGNLGFSNNNTGDIYQIAVTNPSSATPTFTLASHYTGPVAGSSNDGAACVAQPVDLSIAKTGPASVSPSGLITWSIVVTNNGPGASSGFAVNDAVPAGVTNVKSSTSGCAVTGNSVLCSQGALTVGNTTTITLTGTAPSTFGTCFTNTATVLGNEPDPNSANNSSSIQTCTSPGLGLTKTASVPSFAGPGTHITYSYLVTNLSTSLALTAVGVTDPMTGLSAVTCPSTTLAAGASETCTATYTTTQTDVDRGSINNTGTARGTPPTGSALTATSSVTVPATQTPTIALLKTASVGGYTAPGTHITYSYKVTNTGNVTLTSVGVTDPMSGLSAITCTTTTLAPAATETCAATYTTTQADVDRGSIANTGTASGTPPTGAAVTATSPLTIPGTRTPTIGLVKTASIGTFAAAGVPITYSYKVTNTGNVTLTAVGVTDPMVGLSAITCPSTTLAPAAAETCTATYTTTQADVDRGSIANTGTASGTSPTGSTVTATSPLTIPGTRTPSIGLVKSADANSYSATGVKITYSYKVTNTGNVTLTSVGVTDPAPRLTAITCPTTTLAPAASETCTASVTTNQTDVDRGHITNTGTATGTPPTGTAVTAQSTVTVPGVQSPSIGLVKTASPTGFSAAGVLITYSYTVTNSGNVTLTSVGVTDPMSGLSAISCPSTSLAPGTNETCTATYTTTQADVDRGSVTNTGTASGTPPTGPALTDHSTVTVPATRTPTIGLVKTASVGGYTAPGTHITYSYKVTNTGNVTLTAVGVTDPMAGLSAITCTSATLAPNATETCTASYTTTQADVDRGSIANTGTATGTPPTGSAVTAQSSLTIPGTRTPTIGLVKSASVTGFIAAGVAITYSYKVTNTGNVTLTAVGVTDPMAGLSSITCPTTTLAPAAVETCTATYTTTQADVDRGHITNTGTASGTPPTGPAVTAPSTFTVPATQTPTISLTKSASVDSFAAAGTLVIYSYLVTNTGNVTLTAVAVTDPMAGLSAISCARTSLAPGASETCTATYTTTQADVNAGGITNTGTASGTPPTGPAVTAVSPLTVPARQTAAIAIVKSASVTTFSLPGIPITYSYKVTNTGNVTLTSVGVTDPMLGLSAPSCASTTLLVGASETCTATYTTTQADVNRGHITNTGTATGTPPTGPAVVNTDTLTIQGTQTPTITLVKSASITGFNAPGTPIIYSYKVTNNGNVTLTAVAVTDPMSGLSAITCASTTLVPAAFETCTATYTTTQADLDRGSIANTGTATGLPPTGSAVTAQSSVTIPGTQSASITLVKSSTVPSFSLAGTLITYHYLVTNTSNVTLTAVNVTDPMSGLSVITCPTSVLAPGAIETCTATYTTTQVDVDRGGITNTGTVTGTPPTGSAVTDQFSITVPAVQTPSITMVKSASIDSFSFDHPGVGVTYSYLVTNNGNVTLTEVNVTDPMPNLSVVSCPTAVLAPGASETCTATYTTTQADVDNGGITNTGTATGTPPSGPNVTHQSTLVLPAIQTPGIALQKTASPSSFTAAGTLITYSYAVVNSGNVTLIGVTVTDPMLGLVGLTCPRSTLAPRATETCTATYTTTQADVDRGSVTNTGTTIGTPPSGPAVTDQSSVTVPAAQAPAVTLAKSANPSSFTAAGTVITYSYLVTNTGNVSLNPLVVTDPMPGLSAINCSVTALAPTGSETCTATYTTTQANVDAGGVTNTGTATGTPPTGPAVTAQSTVTVPATQRPAITLAKSANPPSFTAAGTVISYHYLVTNSGNVSLTAVGVTDAMPGLSAVSCPSSTLAPAGSETCSATYTTTQADVDAGGLTNTGMATGTPPSGPNVTAQSMLTVPALQTPAITIVKSASVSRFITAGTPITYSYLVTNAGNVSLTAVGVTDPMPGLSAVICPTTTLAPGATETCQASYVTTQADVDAGGLTNTGSAAGTPPSGPAVTGQSTVTVPARQTPGLTLAKSASLTSFSEPGDPVLYSYLVTNAGNVSLTAVGVTDPMTGLSAISCPTTSLAPGATATCTANYTTTQADVDSGGITNTGTATATPPSGPNLTAQSTVTLPATQNPAITLTKSASIGSFALAGTPVTYSYRVTNTGNVTLSPVVVADPMPGLSVIACPLVILVPTLSETCTATYTTTQADVDAGGVSNTGTATGTPPTGPVVTSQSTVTIPASQAPGIGLVKSATPTSFSAAGTLVTYSYLITNSGNVNLTNVVLTDPMLGLSALSCPRSILAPAGSELCTATYTTNQADVDAGGVTNTGTVIATPLSGPPDVTAQSTVTVPAAQSPAITLVKSADVTSFTSAGAPIGYSYLVTNAGNVTLNPVSVTDPMPGLSAIACPATSLAPAASETCTATYTTAQADVDAGSIVNIGTATGTPPSGPAVTDQSTVTITATQTPAVTLVKSADPASFTAAGTVITYSYLVTNSGNVSLTAVGVTDPMPGLSVITCAAASLAPAASETCTATYTTTQADVDAGGLTNTGTATGTPPTGPAVTAPFTLLVPAAQAPAITLAKTASIGSFAIAGTPITYSYLVMNSGNVTLTAVDVVDPMPGLSAISCPTTTLAPAASQICTATYTTTQADVDAGGLTNTGTATGTPPSGPDVTSPSTVTVPALQSPAIGIIKTPSVTSFTGPGTVISYTYLVTNSGNLTLTGVTVTDPMPALNGPVCPRGVLVPGASELCTATYTTTQADVDAGGVTNTGTATGLPLGGGDQVSAISTAVVPAPQSPAITITKSAGITSFTVADTPITYTYVATNTGNVTLNPVSVTDPMPGLSAIACPATSLAPAASETCTATYTTTQADVDAGGLTNTGTATGTPPSGPVIAAQSTVTVPAVQAPFITLTKAAGITSFAAAGTPITYTYVATNTGNVTLNPVSVTDPMPGLSAIACPATSLAPAASETCTATYTTLQADVDAGGLHNVGTASGLPPSGRTVTGTAAVTVPAEQTPSIGLVKTASPTDFDAVGAVITYSYVVTNTGNVTLTGVDATDPMTGLSAVVCPSDTLAPGISETCTATYTTTQADLDAGGITNEGTATGTPPTGPEVTDTSTVTVPAIQHPAIALVKSASPTGFDAAGTVITYSYVVTNTGNVTLSDVDVTDPMTGLSAVACPLPTLAPTDTETCSATYTTTQADVDAGSITNEGTASGTPPTGAAVTGNDSTTVPATQTPSIGLVKTASPTAFATVGAVITYSYKVTNTGNVTLTNVTVTDPMSGLTEPDCPTTILAPAATETCTATYTTTPADVVAGSITNEGTAAGTPPSGNAVTGTDTAVVPFAVLPGITVAKSASVASFSAPGTKITYSYKVTNTGNVPLTAVAVTDPMPGLSAVVCPSTTLALGAAETCTATYTTTQADVDRGSIHNTGTAAGTTPDGTPVTTESSLTVPAVQSPGITLAKSASVASFSAAGTKITYSYKVTNTGNVTLTSVKVTDPMPGLSAISCPATALAPAASETCTATYTTTQADVDKGSIHNTGTASGTLPGGTTVSKSSTVILPDDAAPVPPAPPVAPVSPVSPTPIPVTG